MGSYQFKVYFVTIQDILEIWNVGTQSNLLKRCSLNADAASVKAAGTRTGPRSRIVEETGKAVVEILGVDDCC